jgi:hypothetical protein
LKDEGKEKKNKKIEKEKHSERGIKGESASENRH